MKFGSNDSRECHSVQDTIRRDKNERNDIVMQRLMESTNCQIFMKLKNKL
jgi:hypothetical protein